MPSPPSPFVKRCRDLNISVPQSASAIEAKLKDHQVDVQKFPSRAQKLEAVATLSFALDSLSEHNGQLRFSRWSKLPAAQVRTLRLLYDVPSVNNRPPSMSTVARVFWDNRPGGNPAPAVPPPPQIQPAVLPPQQNVNRSQRTDPPSYRRSPRASS